MQNSNQSQQFLILINLIIHDLITRDNSNQIETNFVYNKKYDFDKNLSANTKGRDYLQIVFRCLVFNFLIKRLEKC